jgi:hypothetical protein
MNRILALAVLVMLSIAETASAKGKTVRIEITGASLATPLQITDPDIVGSFSIWNGPGVTVNGQQVHLDPRYQDGTFIDWPKGQLARAPTGLQRYEVSFYCAFEHPTEEVKFCYGVTYAYDASSDHGYMYLPGPADKAFKSNTPAIYHGVEGNWFRTTGSWERLVRPLIEKATAARPRAEP